ncbi:hypothetical protein WA026_018631 [Henosepilachna vigintioctopunctata]
MNSKNENSQNDSSKIQEAENQSTKNVKKVDQLTYLDLRKCENDELKYFVGFPLKYNGTVYQCPFFSKLNLRDQVKLLCSYHTKITKNVSNQAKLQLECVPFPKSFKTLNCPNFALNNFEMDTQDKEIGDNNNINPFDALLSPSPSDYISKSGRITKRKFYSEHEDAEMKKPRVQDSEWLNNTKNKSPSSRSSVRGKKQLSEDDTNSDTKTISKTNAEIISKSKLFKEKDSPKNSRWTKLMEGMEQQKSKAKQEEIEMEGFNKSLSVDDGLSEYIEDFDNSPFKRRIKPPPVKPKVGKMKKQKEPFAEVELTTQRAHTEKNVNAQSPAQKKASNSSKNDALACTSTSTRKTTANMVQCPICSRDFIHTEIEEHASSCGESRVGTTSNVSSIETMTCRFCDEVFLLDKEYEGHAKICSKRVLN